MMKKMLLSVSLSMGVVLGLQAYQVNCNFDTGASTISTDTIEYKVVVGTGETLNEFKVGYFILPNASSLYVHNSVGGTVAGWAQTADPQAMPYFSGNNTYVAHGQVVNQNTLVNDVRWQGGSLSEGTYYFGYKVASANYNLGEVGFTAIGSSTQADIWGVGQTVNDGMNGALHSVVPEPTSFALIGLGAAVLALRRRKV